MIKPSAVAALLGGPSAVTEVAPGVFQHDPLSSTHESAAEARAAGEHWLATRGDHG